MKRSSIWLTTMLWTLGAAGLAGAAPLNYEGTLTLILGEFGLADLPGGGVASVNASAGTVPPHLNTLRLAASRGGVTTSQFTSIVTNPEGVYTGVAAIVYEEIELGTGTLAPISRAATSGTNLTRDVLPVRGLIKVCLLNTSCTNFLPLVLTRATTVNGVPGSRIIGVGIGGLLTIGGSDPIRMSIQVAPWTIKTRTVLDHITTVGGNQTFVDVTMKGFVHGPLSATTTAAQPSGMVQLVSPAQVMTNLPYGSNGKMAAGQFLLIRFIPEPGLLLLLGTGVAGLAGLGRRRIGKQP